MVLCFLCGKELKNERGYQVHLCRKHKICDSHGRFSLMTAKKFFPLLKNKRWKKAETHLNSIKNDSGDEWIHGYIHALRGLIIGLSASHSPPVPYVVHLKEFSDQKIKELKNGFDNFSEKMNNKNKFDAGYFQAWKDLMGYVIQLL